MLSTSKGLLVAAVGILAGAMAAPASAGAQQPTSVTGCLSKGATKDAFALESTDGKTYALTSSTVKLDEHVGHKVTVTGKSAAVETGALKDTSMKAMKDTSMKKETGATGAGALTVSSLKMVSTQCK
jgi:hypothetical protein